METEAIGPIQLVLNSPLDTERLAKLLHDKDDLFLVWPDARYPFDPDQWKAQLADESQGHRSYFVMWNGKDIGHAALRRSDTVGVYEVSFLYVIPELRSRGVGKEVIAKLEKIARNKLGAIGLTLKVRDYNSRALKCYLDSGFRETGHEGTLIRMRKDIASEETA